MTIIDRIHAQISNRRLLDHPFYQAWSRGELSLDALQDYAQQYYHWTLAFPTFISLTHAQCSDLPARQTLLANLMDEEQGPNNHPELWLRFCDALGLDRGAVRTSEAWPETVSAIQTMRGACAAAPYYSGVAALYAYEVQQPEVARTKREGLSAFYGIDTGHDFFVEHETADVEHSAEEGALLGSAHSSDYPAILGAVESSLGASYTILDGVYRRHCSSHD